jgi:hypothetical protein
MSTDGPEDDYLDSLEAFDNAEEKALFDALTEGDVDSSTLVAPSPASERR